MEADAFAFDDGAGFEPTAFGGAFAFDPAEALLFAGPFAVRENLRDGLAEGLLRVRQSELRIELRTRTEDLTAPVRGQSR